MMNSSWGMESTRNLDKTHLSNPLIAPCGTSPVAEAPPISHSRSNKGFDSARRSHEYSSVEYSESEEERTARYNNASKNASSRFGVGYLDEMSFRSEDGDPKKDHQEVADPPAHEESIYKVMSHNFGKAKEQIMRNDSSTSQIDAKSLERAYMSKRDEKEKASLRKKGKESKGTRHHKGHAASTAAPGVGRTAGPETDAGAYLRLISEEEHDAKVEALTSLDFSVWDHSQSDLVACAWTMFSDAGLIEEFQIPAIKFHNFILALFGTSHDVPYHNYYHYFVVLHTSWLLLKLNPIVQSSLTKTDLLGCFTGAIGHDADHPGLTNSFLSTTRHWLSIRYNDLSVLENHHCATTYTILSRDECNILCNLSLDDWKATRNVIVSAILNTDMARHFNLVANFDKMFKEKTTYECCANRNLRNQIISMIVHCADISNPIKPWSISKRFADSVANEFRAQVEQEKAAGVPCTPHMLGLDTKGQAKMELGFIDVFTWPAMVALNCVLPNLEVFFANMEQNREFWQDIMQNSASRSSSAGKLSALADPGK